MNECRQGSVKATTVCFVFCLARDDLNTVLNQFPTLRASLEARARERLQELYLSENRPLETILALFSDPGLTGSIQTESDHSDLSDLLNSRENDDSETAALLNCTSSILNALAATTAETKPPTPESISPYTSGTSTTQHYLV